MAQHKWHKEIKAWADGVIIEAKWSVNNSDWITDPIPRWNNVEWEFRIKPQPIEPQYLYYWEPYDESENIVMNTRKPQGILDDGIYKYIGKVKLENDNGND